jgi:hypothetical protein
VDVGINGSIKSAILKKWEDWMFNGDGIVDGVAKESSCHLVAEWLVMMHSNIPGQTGRNAWMKTGFERF